MGYTSEPSSPHNFGLAILLLQVFIQSSGRNLPKLSPLGRVRKFQYEKAKWSVSVGEWAITNDC